MDKVMINDKDTIVMNLVNYFVANKNYNPVVVHGINDEIWLENMDSEYRIVRIVSRYIHNNEQMKFNKFRSNQIIKKLKKKTLTMHMNALSIYVDLGDNVTDISIDDDKSSLSILVKSINDLANNKAIIDVFPDIIEKTHHDEDGMELLFKITDNINTVNERKSKKMEKIFSSKKPIVTNTIIILCILMFIISGFGFDTYTLLKYGANSSILVKSGEYYRLFSYMFLHAGFLHIILNMYSLYIVGPQVENFFGKWKYALIYILSGISGGLLSIAFNDNVVSVGASGAIFGLFGALIYFGYNYRGYIGTIIRSQIVPIVIYNLFIGFFIPGIDVSGHVGGLLGGLIVANMLGTIENKKYNISNIMLFVIYFGFLLYLGIFR